MRTHSKFMAVFGLFAFLCFSFFVPAGQNEENPMEDIKVGESTVGKSIKLESKILDLTAHLLVFLPSGYEETQARYPVVFSFRHHEFTSGILSWYTPPMILVDFSNMNYEYFSLYPKENRPGSGNAEKVLRFIKDE